jgi:hypothetical protein
MAGPWENYAPSTATGPWAVPPAGLEPGTRAYADWALQQAMAGKILPKVSETPPAWEAPWVTPGVGEPGIPIISDITRSLYPFERNLETSEYRLAVPKIAPATIESVVDAATLTRDIAAGAYNTELDSGRLNLTPELVGRILNLSSFGVTGAMPKLGPGGITRVGREAATKEADGFGIPLTSGQASADLHKLRAEELMRQDGSSAQPIIRTFDDRQSEAIGNAAGALGKELGGTVDDLTGTLTSGLQKKIKLAQKRADALFRFARDGNLTIEPTAAKALPGFVQQRLAGMIVNHELTPMAAAAWREIQDAGLAADRGPLSWRELDELRVKLAKLSATDDYDIAATQGVQDAFDGWLDDLVDQQLFSGDEEALQALKAARAKSVQYLGVTKPKKGDAAGAVIAKMQQGDATAEQIANWLYGADVVSPSLAATDVAKRLKGLFGPSSNQWKAIRASAWSKLINDPATGEIRPTAALAKRIDEFVNQGDTSLAGTLFSENERNRMKALSAVIKRTILPIDAKNPSRPLLGLGDAANDVLVAILSGAVGLKLGGELPGVLAATAVPVFRRAMREAEARAAIANKPPLDALPYAPSLTARIAAMTANDDSDMDLRALSQQLAQGNKPPGVNDDLANILETTGLRPGSTDLSGVDPATRPRPFLPLGMRNLLREEPVTLSAPPLFQLHA